jgi:uncharacterized BrkB/YihY/UPF0761 family membrane protein
MFEILRSPSRSAAGAIKYVTFGTLMVIWAGLWYFYFLTPPHEAPVWQRFACVGTILSGLAIAGIGLLFGVIGREAKAADNTVGVASSATSVPIVTAAIAPSAANPPSIKADTRTDRVIAANSSHQVPPVVSSPIN